MKNYKQYLDDLYQDYTPTNFQFYCNEEWIKEFDKAIKGEIKKNNNDLKYFNDEWNN